MFPGAQSSPLRVLVTCGFITAASFGALAAASASQPADSPAANRAQAIENYGKLPLSFEANRGQAGKSVKFLSRGNGYSLFLTRSAAVLTLARRERPAAESARTTVPGNRPAHTRSTKTDVVRMQ